MLSEILPKTKVFRENTDYAISIKMGIFVGSMPFV